MAGSQPLQQFNQTQDFGYNNQATSPAATAPKAITFSAALPVAATGVGEAAIVVFEVLGQVPLLPPNFASIQS